MKGYKQYCPIARTLDLLGDKWTLLIVRELLRGKRRFRDIEAGLPGIPPNLLSDRLKALEQAQIVTREYFRELPPRVEYSLTERGASLEPVLESIAGWGMEHMMDPGVPCERVDLGLLFFHLPRFFCPEKARGLEGTVEVRVTGEGGGSWFVTLAGGTCSVCQCVERSVRATISTDLETWVDLVVTHRDPARLLASPGVQFGGDVEFARAFPACFCRVDVPADALAS